MLYKQLKYKRRKIRTYTHPKYKTPKYRIQNYRLQIINSKFKIEIQNTTSNNSNFEFRISNFELRMTNFECPCFFKLYVLNFKF